MAWKPRAEPVRRQCYDGADAQQHAQSYYAPLSQDEIDGLLYMVEEKLARDVYLTLYDQTGLPIFRNISNSEQIHMNMC